MSSERNNLYLTTCSIHWFNKWWGDISRNCTCQQSLFNATLAAWPGDTLQNRGHSFKICICQPLKSETVSEHLIILGTISRHSIVNLEP